MKTRQHSTDTSNDIFSGKRRLSSSPQGHLMESSEDYCKRNNHLETLLARRCRGQDRWILHDYYISVAKLNTGMTGNGMAH